MKIILKIFSVLLVLGMLTGLCTLLRPGTSGKPNPGTTGETKPPDTTGTPGSSQPEDPSDKKTVKDLVTVALADPSGIILPDGAAITASNDAAVLSGIDGINAAILEVFHTYPDLSITEICDKIWEESWKGSLEYQEEGTPYSPYDENAEEFEPCTTNKGNCVYLSQYQRLTDSCWSIYFQENETCLFDMDGYVSLLFSSPKLQGKSFDYNRVLICGIDIETLEITFYEFDSIVDSTTLRFTAENLGIYFLMEKTANPTLISFTISGVEYQAELGMTWREWVASRYNTGSWYIDGTNITNGSATVAHDGDKMEAAYLIWAGTQYTTESGGVITVSAKNNDWAEIGTDAFIMTKGDFVGSPVLFTTANNANRIHVGNIGYDMLSKINDDNNYNPPTANEFLDAFGVSTTNKGNSINGKKLSFCTSFSGRLSTVDGTDGGAFAEWGLTENTSGSLEAIKELEKENLFFIVYNCLTDTVQVYELDTFNAEWGTFSVTCSIGYNTMVAFAYDTSAD